MSIRTARLDVIEVTAELAALEIQGNDALAAALSAHVPEDWPPEEVREALHWFAEQLRAEPGLAGWMNWYALLRADGDDPPTLVASAGFLGPPQDGAVEIGYSMLPRFQGRGFATEIVQGLAEWALVQPAVALVFAEVDPANAASLRVLEKAGFQHVGAGLLPGHLKLERHGSSASGN